VVIAKRLGFSKCRLSLAIPKSMEYNGLDFFNGKKIATSYPAILRKYLSENNINAEIHVITGSVEIAPGIGLADAIFDIVSSGSTLVSNRLKEVEVVLKSEALLIANPNLSEEKKELLAEFIFRLESVQRAKGKKYILLNVPNEKIQEVAALLPGIKSPTVVPLAEAGWSSMHSVISENDFWTVIGKLKKAGAEGILVIPIEKMIF
jgi:ATP phosphoribosyltransferase